MEQQKKKFNPKRPVKCICGYPKVLTLSGWYAHRLGRVHHRNKMNMIKDGYVKIDLDEKDYIFQDL